MIVKHTTHRNLNQAFNEIFQQFPTSWGKDSQPEVSQPAVNIYENDAAFKIEVFAPGRKKEDFKISIEKNILSVAHDKKADETTNDGKVIKAEFTLSGFKRNFSITEKIDSENIQARYEDGILKLTLPKKEEVKNLPKQIEIL